MRWSDPHNRSTIARHRALPGNKYDAPFTRETYPRWVYEHGIGLSRDLAKAFKWYEMAALQNQSLAQNNFGVLYITGRGVQKNEKLAFKWFSKSAEQNNPQAKYNLANLYKNGTGVKKNIKKAIKLYQEAAKDGYKLAEQRLLELDSTAGSI